MNGLAGLPEEMRPRERLMRAVSAEELSDEELLAVLLRTGSRNCAIEELAGRLATALQDVLDNPHAPCDWRSLAARVDDVVPDVHGRRGAARRQRTGTAPAPHVHASQGEKDTDFAHAHRRVHETDFRNCGAVGLQSRLGADNPRGIPKMAGRKPLERIAPGATGPHRLKRFDLETENRF